VLYDLPWNPVHNKQVCKMRLGFVMSCSCSARWSVVQRVQTKGCAVRMSGWAAGVLHTAEIRPTAVDAEALRPGGVNQQGITGMPGASMVLMHDTPASCYRHVL